MGSSRYRGNCHPSPHALESGMAVGETERSPFLRSGIFAEMSGRSVEISSVVTRAIMDRRLRPGAKLGERELSEVFGVSRIVIRQVLIRLADDGLVTIELNRGAFVAKPTLQEVLQTYDAITVIEQGVVANLVGRVHSAGWTDLKRHIEAEWQAQRAAETLVSDDLEAEFHLSLVRLNLNRVLADIHAQLMRRILLFRSLYRRDHDYHALIDDHVKIMSLIEGRQIKRVQDLIGEHYRLVVRGFVLEETQLPALSVAEALLPYLDAVPPPEAAHRDLAV